MPRIQNVEEEKLDPEIRALVDCTYSCIILY